jgi:hypothetical protein
VKNQISDDLALDLPMRIVHADLVVSLQASRIDGRPLRTMTVSPSRPIISVHFPKGSGSTLLAELTATFGEAEVFRDYDDCDPIDPANPLCVDEDRFLQNRPHSIQPFNVVHGHFPIVKYDLLLTAFRLVMLREPVDNLISIYYFWRSLFRTAARGHGLFEYAKRQRLSLLDLAEVPRLRRLMSESYFGDYDMRRFDVIGAYDRRAEFFASISSGIGRTLNADRRENVTPVSEERGNVMNDARLIARLRDLLRDDVRFYERHTSRPRRSWLSRSFFMSGAALALPKLLKKG